MISKSIGTGRMKAMSDVRRSDIGLTVRRLRESSGMIVIIVIQISPPIAMRGRVFLKMKRVFFQNIFMR